MGRKSRTKAARRAERARSPGSAASGSLAGPGTSWVPDASKPAPPQAAAQFAVPASPPPPHPADPGAHLRFLLTRHRAAERDIEEEVHRLIISGHSWAIVGAALGLTRQGARQRYRGLLDAGAGGSKATDAGG